MGLLDRIRQDRAASQSFTYSQSEEGPPWLPGGQESAAANMVDRWSIERLPAYYACRRVISEDAASLPMFTHERLERGRRKAPEHPVYRLLHTRPNPFMTSLVLREVLLRHTIDTGNGYAFLEWNRGMNRLLRIWPLLSHKVRTVWEPVDGEQAKVHYVESTTTGVEERFEDDEILQVMGPGSDGLVGQPMIHVLLQAAGVGLAQQEASGKLFANGVQPGGVYEHPQRLSDPAYARLEKDLKEHSGSRNWHRRLILEEGMKFHQVTIDPEKAQMLEAQEFSVVQICRPFRMPPHKIGHLKEATFSNIEHQGIDYYTSTLRPWLVRVESELNAKCFRGRDVDRFYVEHSIEGFLRGDMKSQAEALAIERQNGVLNADEWRELKNLNPLPDGQGQVYIVPSNMTTIEKLAAPDPEPAPAPPPAGDPDDDPDSDEDPAGEEDDRSLEAAFRELLEDAGARLARRQSRAIARAVKSGAELEPWAAKFFTDERGVVAAVLQPILSAYARAAGRPGALAGEASRMAPGWCDTIRSRMTEWTEDDWRRLPGLFAEGAIQDLAAQLARAADEEAAA